MSQIASAYTITPELIRELNTLAKKEDFESYHKLLAPHAVNPSFGSGYVIAVLIPFLGEHNIQLPSPDTSGFEMSSMDVVTCVPPDEAKKLGQVLEDFELTVDDDELANFYSEFTGETDDFGEEMHEGITYLITAMKAAASKNRYLILSIG